MNPTRDEAATLVGDVLMRACCLTALAGAFYFGLASCGNYAWHKTAFRGWVGMLYVLALMLPGRWRVRPGARVRFALGLPSSYVLLESAIAPFYPGVPDSIADYLVLFVTALEFGPCS